MRDADAEQVLCWTRNVINVSPERRVSRKCHLSNIGSEEGFVYDSTHRAVREVWLLGSLLADHNVRK